jgi:hypothetical protein
MVRRSAAGSDVLDSVHAWGVVYENGYWSMKEDGSSDFGLHRRYRLGTEYVDISCRPFYISGW